ncbi:hypothetical protein [Xanthomonas oryzae]|uniref:hypothetical protein n=1 Tax=Xanthomonas oryzae TaxID=347 RepID=UPI00104D36FF|nr:hypothetical protein [Xanthomonas oryzae]QBG85296.1 hypothetical protein EYR27_17485 [Xanthomonas oryzae]
MLNQIRTLDGNAKILEIDLRVELAILNTKASTVSYCQIDNQSLAGTSTGVLTDIGQFGYRAISRADEGAAHHGLP